MVKGAGNKCYNKFKGESKKQQKLTRNAKMNLLKRGKAGFFHSKGEKSIELPVGKIISMYIEKSDLYYCSFSTSLFLTLQSCIIALRQWNAQTLQNQIIQVCSKPHIHGISPLKKPNNFCVLLKLSKIFLTDKNK